VIGPQGSDNLCRVLPEETSSEDAQEQRPELSYVDRIKTLWSAMRADFIGAGVGQKLGLMGMVAFIAYEWGPGNEVATPLVGAQVLARTSGLTTVIATSLITGGFTFVEQMASGWTVAYTGSQFPRLNRTAYELTQDQEGNARYGAWDEISLGKRFAYAFYLGSTAAVIREGAVTGKTRFRELRRPAFGSAVITSSTIAVLGAVLGATKWACAGTPAQPYADVLVAIVSSPLTWLGLLVITLGYGKLTRRQVRVRARGGHTTADVSADRQL
jgi:hypothetical protein